MFVNIFLNSPFSYFNKILYSYQKSTTVCLLYFAKICPSAIPQNTVDLLNSKLPISVSEKINLNF